MFEVMFFLSSAITSVMFIVVFARIIKEWNLWLAVQNMVCWQKVTMEGYPFKGQDSYDLKERDKIQKTSTYIRLQGLKTLWLCYFLKNFFVKLKKYKSFLKKLLFIYMRAKNTCDKSLQKG